jgi:hypothetical protein
MLKNHAGQCDKKCNICQYTTRRNIGVAFVRRWRDGRTIRLSRAADRAPAKSETVPVAVPAPLGFTCDFAAAPYPTHRAPTKSHFMSVRPRLRRASPSHGPVLLASPALPPWAPPSPPRRYGRRAREGNSLWIHHFPPIGKGISFSITPVAPEAPATQGVTEKVPEGRMRPERSEQDARTYPSDGWATPGPIEHELDFAVAPYPTQRTPLLLAGTPRIFPLYTQFSR